MDLKKLQKDWNHFGETDPLWAVLAHPDKRGNRWEASDFFATGVAEIQAVLAQLDSLGVELRRSRALDFGCGVGRLTQALAADFDHVTGVDIAPSMVELAAQYNRAGDRCSYVLNETEDLRRFSDSTFDFIYSNIVLQHMKPRYSLGYVKEFLRVLAPGGIIVFQLPARSRRHLFRLASIVPGALPLLYRILHGSRALMEMHGVPMRRVVRFLARHRAQVLHVRENDLAGPEWTSFQYYVTAEKR